MIHLCLRSVNNYSEIFSLNDILIFGPNLFVYFHFIYYNKNNICDVEILGDMFNRRTQFTRLKGTRIWNISFPS